MYFKILKENLKHYNMQYQLGLNVNCEETLYDSRCRNGLFFTDENYIMAFANYGTKIAVIELPENERISACKDNYKAHQIIIKEIHDLWTLKTFKWLEELGVNFHTSTDETFIYACRNGNLDIAKWLYNLGGVNIHADDDEAFRHACENGYLDIAKWLYNLGGVNMHANNDYAYYFSSEKVNKWLETLEN